MALYTDGVRERNAMVNAAEYHDAYLQVREETAFTFTPQ